MAVDRITGRPGLRPRGLDGLNATLASYHDSMDFGFVANAAALDDLPRLARCTQQAYEELKEGAGLKPAHAKRASS